MIKIAIDAMGADSGVQPMIEGTIEALKAKKFHPILVGSKELLIKEIPSKYANKIEILDANEVVQMHNKVQDAIKNKNTSIYKSIDLAKNGTVDAVVSAGHSGVTMSLATIRLGRIKGVNRPAIATLMPTVVKHQKSLLLDVGANVDSKPRNLFEFAIMGEKYAKDVIGIQNPKVGLLSIGEEDIKGNDVTKEAFIQLKQLDSFIGNVEGNNIFDGSVDVIVCDGFAGNIVLKTSEGVAESIASILKQNIKKSLFAILGAVLMNKVFKVLKETTDYAEYGGAPLLGLKGNVIVAHGKSNSKAIKNAIFQAISFAESKTQEDIKDTLVKYS
ncbi:MAG: Phosphate:acyl-ACP acyltransferase PlsX [uncultured Campylobacterales bacterium]|uniref:Phosphate acyltransferase n=1 Tax=uncultured Campylobacterales bacterium TaxID=352960 RepID=A0A6S6S6G4_9BACT|nr:MAG: Phosphate:acyl-ACP acyltransferase PlsX [uncultured Campylobacterales bacterium]